MGREITVTIETSSAGVSVDPGESRTVTLYRDGDPVPGESGGAVTSVAGRTGAVTLTSTDLTDTTPAGRALLDDADAAAQRATLGLGNSAGLNVGTTAGTVAAGNDSRLSDARTPTSHAASHQSGGGDAIKLDDLAAPDDNTDLNATTGAHGLLPKLGGGTSNFLRADGTWAAPAGGSPGGSSGQLQYNNAGAFGGIAGTSWASNQLLMTAQDAATTPLAVRAAASHTAAGFEYQNPAGTALAKITAAGNFVGPTYTSGGYVPAFGFAGYETTGVMGYQTSCYFISGGSIAFVASSTSVATRTNSPLSWRDSGSSTTRGSIVATSAGDIEFTPTGTGLMKFGSHSGIAAEMVTGYIEIKDAGGTTRKLAVVS